MRAVIEAFAFIHVVATEIVGGQHKSCFASTTVRSDEIDANVGAVSVVLDTLVKVSAGESVLCQLVAIVTRALEAALGVYASLLATELIG